LSQFFPEAPIIPTVEIIPKAFKDPDRLRDALKNPLGFDHPYLCYVFHLHIKLMVVGSIGRFHPRQPRLATAAELLRVTDMISSNMESFSAPFLILHGEQDIVTDPAVSKEFFEKSSSKDKSARFYPGYWHALTVGEAPEDREIVFRDIADWINERC